MSTYSEILVQQIGWSLLHLVWQGFGIAAVVSLVLLAMRGNAPSARYVVLCGALAAFSVMPVVNLVWLNLNPITGTEGAKVYPSPYAVKQLGGSGAETNIDPEITGADNIVPEPAALLPHRAETIVSSGTSTMPMRLHSPFSFLERHMEDVVLLWATGAALFALRLLGGWVLLRGLYRQSHILSGAEIEETFIRLAARMNVPQRVRIFLSPNGNTPVTFGFFKPVILMPASIITGLPAAHLEALLAHELAHIRRHDYLVNWLQSIVETLFYFHPAVWWISGRIRTERELCCDAIAAKACEGGASSLAQALVQLEERRLEWSTPALAAAGSPLIMRIRRLLNPKVSTRSMSGAGTFVCFAAVLSVCVYSYASYAQMGQLPGEAIPATPAAIASPVQPEAAGFAAAPYGAPAAPEVYPGLGPGIPVPGVGIPGLETPAPQEVGLPGAMPPMTSITEPTTRVFDLSAGNSSRTLPSRATAGVLSQIKLLLYPDPASTPVHHKLWYDDEEGLLTIVDTPLQLDKVSNFLRQPWVRGVLQQDDGLTTYIQRRLAVGDTLKFGGVALRLESVSAERPGVNVPATAEVLLRRGQNARLASIAKFSSVWLHGCDVSVLELNASAAGTTHPVAMLEIRLPLQTAETLGLPALSGIPKSTSLAGAPAATTPLVQAPDIAELPRMSSSRIRQSYKVRVGTNLDQKGASKLVDELKREGYQPVELRPRKDGKFDVTCGLSFRREETENFVRDLKSAGFSPVGIVSPSSDAEAMPAIPSI